MNLQKAEFLTSLTDLSKLPKDGLPQIAFSGKSNVGKSSVINRVLQRKNFARVGETPGKTIHINFFRIDNRAYFVDLPGYGYAKVAKSEKERWGRLFQGSERPWVVVANKLDKLKKSEVEPNLALIRETLALDPQTPLIPFSAEKGTGREDLLREILRVCGELD